MVQVQMDEHASNRFRETRRVTLSIGTWRRMSDSPTRIPWRFGAYRQICLTKLMHSRGSMCTRSVEDARQHEYRVSRQSVHGRLPAVSVARTSGVCLVTTLRLSFCTCHPSFQPNLRQQDSPQSPHPTPGMSSPHPILIIKLSHSQPIH